MHISNIDKCVKHWKPLYTYINDYVLEEKVINYISQIKQAIISLL